MSDSLPDVTLGRSSNCMRPPHPTFETAGFFQPSLRDQAAHSRGRFVVLWAMLVICALAGKVYSADTGTNATAKPAVTFKPQEMADALHAVIAADREVYARYFDQRSPGDNTRSNSPVPAHLLRQASEAIQTKGAEFHYVLRSLWPLNSKNGPETSTEKTGLEAVLKNPEQAFYAEESLGGRRYFTAVYADKATVPSCIRCHNAHAADTKKTFKDGDVMGGLVVRVPLEF